MNNGIMPGGRGGNMMSTEGGIKDGGSKSIQVVDFNNNAGDGRFSPMEGGRRGRGLSDRGGSRACTEVSDDSFSNNMFHNSANDDPQGCINTVGISRNQSRDQGEDRQGSNNFQEGRSSFQEGCNSFKGERQSFDDGHGDGNYCQSQQGQGGQRDGNQDSADQAAQSSGIFMQQVATLAMNVAEAAFKNMEDASSRAREAASRSRASRPYDNPTNLEMNDQVKKLQSEELFKLKTKPSDGNMIVKLIPEKEEDVCGPRSLQQTSLLEFKGSGGGGASGTFSISNSNAQGGQGQDPGKGPSGGGGVPGLPESHSTPTLTRLPKNDKAVEVHLDHRVIARFQTQTECARYLRTTPEAVSYHCSKGGGMCNGLTIRPLGKLRDEAAADDIRFGLLEGALEHRPKEWSQLKPETAAILKEWLMSPDHMDNPYPNQWEAELLMSKTGLDKTQLKNWFNNARKRILKPLIEKVGKAGLVAEYEQVRREAAEAVALGIGKSRGASPGTSMSTKGGPIERKRKRHTDGGQSPSASAAANPPSSPPDASLCGANFLGGSSSITRKISADPSSPHNGDEVHLQRQVQMQIQRMRQQRRQQHFGNSFQDFHGGGCNDSSHGDDSNNNNPTPNQFERFTGRGGMNDSGMSGGQSGTMMFMGGGITDGGSKNDQVMCSNSKNGNGGFLPKVEGLQGRGSSGMGASQACTEVGNDSSTTNMFDNMVNDDPLDCMNSADTLHNQRRGPGEYQQGRNSFQEGRHSFQEGCDSFQCSRQSFDDGHGDGNYCQSPKGQGGQRHLNQDSADEAGRSNAFFMQQAAALAMNEAEAAFKNMVDASSRAREAASRSRASRPEDRRDIFEMKDQAKKLQSVDLLKSETKPSDETMIARLIPNKEEDVYGPGSLQQTELFDFMRSGGGGASGTSSLGNSNAQGGQGQDPGKGPSGGGGAPGLAESPPIPTLTWLPKNDKAVEVHLDRRVIARFQNQAECARYLRTTPEAVSYHCSKGGGTCNGLAIRPLGELRDKAAADEIRFGLLEGALEHRPKERARIKPGNVAILKEWLLSPDHVDNPYPNQWEAELLISKTGLDKTQLKNWFNNARKRILKPLIEKGGKAGLAVQHEKVRREAAMAVSSGTGKSRGASPGTSMSTKGVPAERKRKRHADGGQSPSASAATIPSSPPPDASLRDAISLGGSSSVTRKISADPSSPHDGDQGHLRQVQMQIQRMRQQWRQQHFGDSFQEFHGSGNSDSGRNSNPNKNNPAPNQFERFAGYGGMNDSSMWGGQGRTMMSMVGEMMGGGSRNNQVMVFNSNYGDGRLPPMEGGFQSRVSSGMGGSQACMELGNDSSMNNMFDNRLNESPMSHMNSVGRSHNQSCAQGEYQQGHGSFQEGRSSLQEGCNSFQGSRQSFNYGYGDNNYYQSKQGQGGQRQDSAEEAVRSNAVFMRQVAAMAMNEAEAAFKEMEDASSRAREAASRSCASRLDEDPAVLEANNQAKKLQNVALFKLKVSQRASEEAANANSCYQRMVGCLLGGSSEGGGGSGGDGGGGSENKLGNGPGGYQR